MDVDACIRQGLLKRTVPDAGHARSLLEMAAASEVAVRSMTPTAVTVSPILTLAYDALHSVMEAIAVGRGYKALSHVCLGELLKGTEGFDHDLFDRLRYVRNGINYYGKPVGLQAGTALIGKALAMKAELVSRHLT